MPGKPVKVGDSWPLEVSLVSMDANFVCDSSYKKNMVNVIAIHNTINDTIVTLKYDITEYVNGNFNSPFVSPPVAASMKMTYTATADFSIEKGRWIKYEGVMSNTSTGIMSVQTKERYALIPE